ncbi:hypothetical protein ACIPWB_32020 [[Kitasatospora] papulosa]
METVFEDDEGRFYALGEHKPVLLYRQLDGALNEFPRQAGDHLNQR